MFHFIQCSDIECVSEADALSQIEVLNEDFRKMAGTAGFGNGVDTEYEFCLATIDPYGCPQPALTMSSPRHSVTMTRPMKHK